MTKTGKSQKGLENGNLTKIVPVYKIAIYFFKLQEELSALQTEHPALQNMHFLHYFPFVAFFLAFRDPDPDSDDPVSESRFL
jgi:hypothetical protein